MRDVLVICVGMSPQVVTEALWALAHRPEATRLVPTRVHILTTAKGAEATRKGLLGIHGKLEEFRKEFALPAIGTEVHVLGANRKNGPIDPFAPEARQAFVSDGFAVVHGIAADHGTRIHACLGGGLNFMPAFLFGIMSLCGREQDEMSDVQVPPTFAGCPEFWWIPKIPRDLTHRDGPTYNTGSPECRIDLNPIPFPKLHRFLADGQIPTDVLSFVQVMERTQRSIDAGRVTFFDSERTIRIGGTRIRLRHRSYALYRTLAEAAHTRRPGAGPHGVGLEHHGWLAVEEFVTHRSWAAETFLRCLPVEGLKNDEDGVAQLRERIESQTDRSRIAEQAATSQRDPDKLLREARRDLIQNVFSQAKRGAVAAIGRAISDPVLLNRVNIQNKTQRRDDRNRTRWGLLLQPGEIEFCP